MMQIQTPDIGVDKALVAEILVKVGDSINENDSIVLLESDKASVEVPSPSSGIVKAILVAQGDSVKEGVVLLELDTNSAQTTSSATVSEVAKATETEHLAPAGTPVTDTAITSNHQQLITVPDIGVDKALVAEVLVKVGDTINENDSIVLLESDKASVEVPSPSGGIVKAILVAQGDTVKEGVALLEITSNSTASTPTANIAVQSHHAPIAESVTQEKPQSQPSISQQTTTHHTAEATGKLTIEQQQANAQVYAGPAVRQLARELGVLLSDVQATGKRGRIVKEDVFNYVKTRLSTPITTQAASTAVAGLPPLPDFTAFGGGEIKEMTRLQQVSVPQLSLNNFIPQVTQFDLADITELEAWRNELKENFKKQGVSLTILAFITKAVAHLLKEEPYFAAHLSDDQKSVLLRHEIHMGIAVATPDGLTVPVLRNPDQKSIKQIAQELGELSKKAREKKLSPKDLQGANFTITSLGSIGGTAFTPLVNWPQVAILGISPATMQPVWNGTEFEPRLMLPLSLSYDHRVINGADAAQFTRKLTGLLKDIRNVLL